jgi:hypothetical protein
MATNPATEAKLLAGSIILVPFLMTGIKMMRMDGREMHEVHMDIRYKATFWEKGNRFNKQLQETLWASVVDARKQELAAEELRAGAPLGAAAAREEAGAPLSVAQPKKSWW